MSTFPRDARSVPSTGGEMMLGRVVRRQVWAVMGLVVAMMLGPAVARADLDLTIDGFTTFQQTGEAVSPPLILDLATNGIEASDTLLFSYDTSEYYA